MYAIVEIAGQQFKVEKDQQIFVHRLGEEEGAKVISFKEAMNRFKEKPIQKKAEWDVYKKISTDGGNITIDKDSINIRSEDHSAVFTVEEAKEFMNKINRALRQHKKHFTK